MTRLGPTNPTVPPPKTRPSRILLQPQGRGFLGRWMGRKRYLHPQPMYLVAETHNTLTPPVGTLLTAEQAQHLIDTSESHVIVVSQ